MASEEEVLLRQLLKEKEERIQRYMKLQDQIDAANEQVYKLTCEIEALNVKIEALRIETARQAPAKKSSANFNKRVD